MVKSFPEQIWGQLDGPVLLFNTSASDLHEAEIKSGGFPDPIFIDLNEFALNQGENILAVQVHNYNMNSSDLSCIPNNRLQFRKIGFS